MLNKFLEYFSIVKHPYRYYALLFTIIFSSTRKFYWLLARRITFSSRWRI